jgi:hypothetical protein
VGCLGSVAIALGPSVTRGRLHSHGPLGATRVLPNCTSGRVDNSAAGPEMAAVLPTMQESRVLVRLRGRNQEPLRLNGARMVPWIRHASVGPS